MQVNILLSTYNGAEYLRPLINSILNQTFTSVKLIMRDDSSNDKTVEILSEYAEVYPDRIILINDQYGNLGSSKAFIYLLNCTEEGAYVMFCDQDDLWLPGKVQTFYEAITKLEGQSDLNLPSLIFGDMVVVDQDHKVICPSFWKYQKINPEIAFNWKYLASQNVVTGCSLIMNPAAVKMCRNSYIPYVHHDQTVSVLISKYGKVGYITEPTMHYVQHDQNVVGASKFSIAYIVYRVLMFRRTFFGYYNLSRHFEISLAIVIILKIYLTFKRFVFDSDKIKNS